MKPRRRETSSDWVFALIVVVASAAVLLALRYDLGDDLLGGVLSWLALMAAILLGYLAYGTAIEELQESRRATELANQPILVPIHEPATAGVTAEGFDTSYPAKESYRISPGDEVQRAFRVERPRAGADADAPVQNRAVIYLKNVGQGPGIVSEVALWSAEGRGGVLRGTTVVSPGTIETLVVSLSQVEWRDPAAVGTAWEVQEELIEAWKSEDNDRLFFLEVRYDDVFHGTEPHLLRAWFDPTARGQWHTESTLRTVPKD